MTEKLPPTPLGFFRNLSRSEAESCGSWTAKFGAGSTWRPELGGEMNPETESRHDGFDDEFEDCGKMTARTVLHGSA